MMVWCLAMSTMVMIAGVDPYALRKEALVDLDKGLMGEAQEKLIEAYDLFIEAENWDMASMCLYERAIEYLNIGDMENMLQLVERLMVLYDEHASALVGYNYHSVAAGYYTKVDSVVQATWHGERSIRAMEQIDDPRLYNIMPIWNYYNQALIYDMLYQPPLTDSVKHYLKKAREVIVHDMANAKDSIEALISVVDLEAWQEYYVGNYRGAERMMHEVLAMVDTIAKVSPNTIITERGEAYSFLAMISEEQGQWRKAYGYQKLLLENNKLRYDMERRRVLQEVQTQYEVAKQSLEIDKLAAENRSNRWLLVTLWLFLVVLVLALWLVVLRRRQAESRLYEAALEADNMRETICQLEQQTDVEPLRLLVDGLVQQLQESKVKDYTERAVDGLREMDLGHVQVLLSKGSKITKMDKRYVLCFAAGMSVEEVADFMCLEPASVYTVRYRLRKKFDSKYPFPY